MNIHSKFYVDIYFFLETSEWDLGWNLGLYGNSVFNNVYYVLASVHGRYRFSTILSLILP